MENSSSKIVSLIDRGYSSKVQIDFENMTFTRLQDKRSARIEKIEKNVVYLAGIDPTIKNALAFDDKFAILAKVNSVNLVYSQKMGIWDMPKQNAIFFEVSKNACTSVVTEIYNSNYKTWWGPKIKDNTSVWTITNSKNGYYKDKMMIPHDIYLEEREGKYKNYRKFLIWDDPVNRFLRMANNKYINHHTIASSIQPPYDKNISDYIDKLLLVIQLDCLNSQTWDQHLAPISLNGKEYLDDITDFVRLNDLNSFMSEKFNITMQRHNAMPTNKKVVTREILLPRQIEKIQELYSGDYEIESKYKDKFYSPNIN